MSAPEAHEEDTEMLAKWREVREQIAGAREERRRRKRKSLRERGSVAAAVENKIAFSMFRSALLSPASLVL